MSEGSSRNDELCAHCKSDSLSEDGLREIIERHELTNDPSIGAHDFFSLACRNEKVNYGIMRCLVEYFPAAASATDNDGCTPLHVACDNKNVTLNIVQLLIDAAPNSVRSITKDSWMPLHYFCRNRNVINENTTMDILKLLIEKCPEAVRHADNRGFIPIHLACMSRSPEFCRVLIEAYPGSERISSVAGSLPLHYACFYNTVAVVEYMYKLYPDAINHATTNGKYPIHFVIAGLKYRPDPAAVYVVKFLLNCDPNVTSQQFQWLRSLLHFACRREYNDSNIEAGIQVIEVIYDAHPETIENNDFASNIHDYHQRVQEFINSQLVYSRQVKDHRLMMTPNEKGRLPLPIALQNNARLGSIKLLVRGNPSALRSLDNNFALPLHIACQHHDSSSVVQYLLSQCGITLDTVDREGNTALHYACFGAKYDTIELLLDKFDAVSVSKRNAHKKLPIDLLLESNQVLDRESVDYTESIFRLLKAYPETVMKIGIQQQRSALFACPSDRNE
jgi:ankyrin repeat protein